MKRNIFALGLFILLSLQLCFSQSKEELVNRAVYNRIEYLFNAKQPDSIYHLAHDSFKKQVSSSEFNNILQQLFALDQIQNATVEEYNRGVASYRIDFKTETLTMLLGVDSAGHFHTLGFKPYVKKQEVKEEPVISEVEKTNPFDEKVDSIAKAYVQQKHAQSLAIAVIRQGNVGRFFYGETEKGNGNLPTADTQYEIGSITKTFTATLLADLVEKNIISLDDTITKFLPDSIKQNPELQKITFKQLANHTSGLPRLPNNFTKVAGYNANNPYATYRRADLFAYLKDAKLVSEPETEYEYSNLGYGLLGELITIISKKSFSECLTEIITSPIHMSSTNVRADVSNIPLAVAYKDGERVPVWDFEAIAGAGALKSTINDMLRYTITQMSMPESSLQKAMAMTKLFSFFIPPNTDIGLAWHMDIIEDVTCYWHNGGTGGSASYLGMIPDEKSAVIILSNSNLSVTEAGKAIIQEIINIKEK